MAPSDQRVLDLEAALARANQEIEDLRALLGLQTILSLHEKALPF